MEHFLEVNNLSIGIKGKTGTILVNNISFKVNQGETLGIVGESGSGKTLSAMSIVGLLPKAIEIKSGNINIHEDENVISLILDNDQEYRKIRGKKCSVIFQEPLSSLNPSMRCGNQVKEIILEHNKLKGKTVSQKVLELFREVDLSDPEKVYKSYPFQLSGGQQQRVMIAMAIANKPDYIIADEPTTALDVLVQKKIITLLQSLQQKYGMGIIFISHDIDLVASISHYIIVMRNGRLIESGNVKKIIKSPESTYTKGLIESKPRPDTPRQKLKMIDEDNSSAKKELIVDNVDYKTPPVLEIKNVDIFYQIGHDLLGKSKQDFHAIKNITFSVYKGETLGIVGRSGSGKSTIGKAIVRLINKMSGNILYHGEIISDTHMNFNKFRKKIQLIFQDPFSSLNPKQKIGDAIYEVLKYHNLCKNKEEGIKIVGSLLHDVKLGPEFYHRYPHELSGGQRQRIVIARALAVNPELIICDEAVSSLDVSIQAEVLNLLNEIKQQKNLTLIFISHDLSVVKYMSHRIVILNEGKIVEIIESEQLFKNSKSEYTKQLLNAMVLIN